MAKTDPTTKVSKQTREQLVDAEAQYRRALNEDYITRLIRDDAIVEAHRSGMSSREISEIVGDIGQPNVVRARRRSAARRDALPNDLLSPTDAVRASGMTPALFVAAVREGRITPVVLENDIRAFRPNDVETIATGRRKSQPRKARPASA